MNGEDGNEVREVDDLQNDEPCYLTEGNDNANEEDVDLFNACDAIVERLK